MGATPLRYPFRLPKSRERSRAGPLRYPLRSPKSRGQNQAGPFEVPVVLAEVKGMEPGGSLLRWLRLVVCAVVSPLASRRCRRAVVVVFGVVVENVIVEFVGESPCEQFFVSMNPSVLFL